MEPTQLIASVESMSKQGMMQLDIATELGYKTPNTLHSRLIKASQATDKLIPAFRRPRKDKYHKIVEMVEVRKRGRGDAFGVNIPQEPLSRIGATTGTKLSVKVTKGRIALSVQ